MPVNDPDITHYHWLDGNWWKSTLMQTPYQDDLIESAMKSKKEIEEAFKVEDNLATPYFCTKNGSDYDARLIAAYSFEGAAREYANLLNKGDSFYARISNTKHETKHFSLYVVSDYKVEEVK